MSLKVLNIDLPGYLDKRWKSLGIEYKYGFFIGIISALFAHGFLLCNLIVNEDGTGQLKKTYLYWQSARWLSDYYIHLREDFCFPFLIILVSIIFMVTAGCLNAAIWKARSRWTVGVIASLYATFPAFASGFSYQFMGDIYPLACLLAVLAVYFAVRGKTGSVILGSFLLVLSLALYQAFLAVAATICLLSLILDLARTQDRDAKGILKALARQGLVFIIFGMLAGIGYVLSVKALPWLHPGVQMNSYRGANSIGSLDIAFLPNLITKSYQGLASFMRGQFCRNPTYVQYAMFTVFTLFGLTVLVQAGRLAPGWKTRSGMIVLLLLMVLALPLSVFITGIFAPTELDLFQTFGMIPLLGAAVCTLLESRLKPLKNVAFIASCILILGFVNRSNAITLKGYLWTQASFLTANRMLARIEAVPEFGSQSRVAFVGKLPNSLIKGTGLPPFTETTRGWKGGPPGFADSRSAASTIKICGILSLFDYRLNPANREEYPVAEKRAAAMPSWPAAGSIQAFGDLIVVNLSDRLIQKVTLEKTGKNTLRFVAHVTPNAENPLYAWRISQSGVLVKDILYNKSNILDFAFETDGTFTVSAVVKTAELGTYVVSPDIIIRHSEKDGGIAAAALPKEWRLE